MKQILLILSLSIPLILRAQENNPDLITDRPDQTESSKVVPWRKLQIETGFIMANDETTSFKQKSFAYNSTLLRYGLLENLELRIGMEYLGEKLNIKEPASTKSITGFSPLYTGFKVKVEDEDGWRPEIAFLGGMILPFTASENFKTKNSGASFRFAFSHSLTEKFSLGYNIGAEWDGDSAAPGYFYSAVLGIALYENLGTFVESYGTIREKGNAEHMLDAGFTYLVLPNLQLDISAGIGINNSALDNFISLGLSYRIPD